MLAPVTWTVGSHKQKLGFLPQIPKKKKKKLNEIMVCTYNTDQMYVCRGENKNKSVSEEKKCIFRLHVQK